MKKLEMDMTTGTIFNKIVRFSIPLMLMNILQLLFNAADIFVLGIFVNDNAVAAVGANSALINLIINLFIGLSVGSNVVVAMFLGENNKQKIRENVGLSIFIALVSGIILLFIGFFCARTFLTWMGCDEVVLDMAVKYLKIYFLGMPVIMLYNFCASILRAAGDTVRPLIYLSIGGVINVILNIFFVLVLKKDVEGVAIATVVSQGIAAVLCLITLSKNNGVVKLEFKYIRFKFSAFLLLVKIGVPSGIQSCLFSLSNVIIQSSVNSLGAKAMSGYSYEMQIANIVYVAMNAIALACMSFVGQNYGAKDIKRIKKIIIESIIFVSIVGIVFGVTATFLGPLFLSLITDDKEVILYCKQILYFVSLPYFLCGIMDVVAYAMRSLGKSFTTMIICIFGACILRIIWIQLVFNSIRTAWSIFISYPISWIIVIIAISIFLSTTLKKLEKQYKENTEKDIV
ncbi:MAG: MATE family efflux transporter, partial [Firmicutes bacterium]|nr:MATE family efflux transporter [Candidatus Caballimonas caccae]